MNTTSGALVGTTTANSQAFFGGDGWATRRQTSAVTTQAPQAKPTCKEDEPTRKTPEAPVECVYAACWYTRSSGRTHPNTVVDRWTGRYIREMQTSAGARTTLASVDHRLYGSIRWNLRSNICETEPIKGYGKFRSGTQRATCPRCRESHSPGKQFNGASGVWSHWLHSRRLLSPFCVSLHSCFLFSQNFIIMINGNFRGQHHGSKIRKRVLRRSRMLEQEVGPSQASAARQGKWRSRGVFDETV